MYILCGRLYMVFGRPQTANESRTARFLDGLGVFRFDLYIKRFTATAIHRRQPFRSSVTCVHCIALHSLYI